MKKYRFTVMVLAILAIAVSTWYNIVLARENQTLKEVISKQLDVYEVVKN